MPLTQLKSPAAAARWLASWVGGTLRTDSRDVQPGDGFIAWPGHARDGRQFVAQALDSGAATALVEQQGVAAFGFENARVAALPGLKAAAGLIADAYFDQPSQQLTVVATTGTNGKTSTAWWTAQALTALGQRCGVVGTLGIGEPPSGDGQRPAAIQYTGLTTPDPVRLQRGFRAMVDAGFAACAIEASSHGIEEHRLTGTAIDVAIFTNFTQDHLDYHGSMEAYWAAKRKLFAWPGLGAAVINVDDAQGAMLVAHLADQAEGDEGGDPLAVWTISVGGAARLQAQDVRYEAGGLAFTVVEGPHRAELATRLIGDYNVSNLLGVIGALRALGVSLVDAAWAAQDVSPVPGRMQRIAQDGGPEVVVDYAHTPDALDKALAALRPLATARGGQLHVVFGCGGDRDPGKRPQMGRIAAEHADTVLLTSDNPRTESPIAIVQQIAVGAPGARIEIDRAAAIAQAVREAAPADVVLIAGKGHEDYQEVMGQRHPFDDAVQAAAALEARA
ncbi:MAG: UDP-N-acetylmuramoyl-L-alanyl-D-glutamate--2,6-diaminopimelate ligase [Proteobacteria bacterium]|nr:UDP-N-acetylmuramoyl-L-alanyl-D-glutamate--2,6-diaminopimelate ligase [Pseudomonadota bacterium]